MNFGAGFYACGKQGLPKQVVLDGGTYRLRKVLKNDFFAATALYEIEHNGRCPETSCRKVILKIGRQEYFLIFPMLWLGRFLCNHELTIYQRLAGIKGVPRILSVYGETGFIYEYIEGRSLDERPKLPDDFFDNLRHVIKQVHLRKIAYLDMNKRGNILVASDGRPHLIDFQISLHLTGIFALLRNALQRGDTYHLFKHKRKFSRRLLTQDEYLLSYRPGLLIHTHRLIANPYKKIRRMVFRYLYQKGILAIESGMHLSRENDPGRFLKK